MTVKSVIEIDLDDSRFQRFKELFDKYTAALEKTPGVWNKAAEAQQKLHRFTRQNMEQQNADLGYAQRLWTSIELSTRNIAGNLISATGSLIRWTGLLSVAGAAFGIGSLPYIASGIAGERRSAMGLGVTIGQQRAFGTSFERLLDPGAFLGWIAQSQQDITMQRPFRAFFGRGPTGNTEQDALQMMDAIRGLARRTDYPFLAQQFGARGIPYDPLTARRFKDMPEEEYQRIRGLNASLIPKLEMPPALAKAYQEFDTTMKAIKESLHNTFVLGMAPLLPSLTKLSTSFGDLLIAFGKSPLVKEGIEALGHGFEWLAKKINSPEFTSAIERFASGLVKAADFFMPKDKPEDRWYNKLFEYVGNVLEPLSPAADPTDASGRKNFMTMASIYDRMGHLPDSFMEYIKYHESGLGLNAAKGAAGELGVMQLMSPVAKRFGDKYPGRDPGEDLKAAYLFVQALRTKYHDDWGAVIAGYNMGEKTFDPIYNAYGREWPAHVNQKTLSYAANAPGATIRVEVATGANVNITTLPLGAP